MWKCWAEGDIKGARAALSDEAWTALHPRPRRALPRAHRGLLRRRPRHRDHRPRRGGDRPARGRAPAGAALADGARRARDPARALRAREVRRPRGRRSAVHKMPGHAGFAYGFTVASRGRRESWFLRLPPPDVQWRGTADVLRQVEILNALDGTDVPHCSVHWSGDELEWFGRPYFVVPKLEGDVLRLGPGEWGAKLPAGGAARRGGAGDARARGRPPRRLAPDAAPRRADPGRRRRRALGPLPAEGRRAAALRAPAARARAPARDAARRRADRRLPRRLPGRATCSTRSTGGCSR